MTKVSNWTLIESLALDSRISDKWFRWIWRELRRPNLAHKMMRERVELLKLIAITETERDEKVNGKIF